MTNAEKLLNYLAENYNVEEYRDVCENLLSNYLSDDDVKDFCESEGYEDALKEVYDVTVEFSGSITYKVTAISEEEARDIGEDMYQQESSSSIIDNIDDYTVSAELY